MWRDAAIAIVVALVALWVMENFHEPMDPHVANILKSL